MDVDRVTPSPPTPPQPAPAPVPPMVEPFDPNTAIAKAPRPSPAAQILGALVSPAHADDSVKHDFVAMRSAAVTPNLDADFDALISNGKQPAAPGASGAGDAVAPGAVQGAAQGAQTAPPQPEGSLASRVLGGVKATFADIGKGVLTSPKQVIGGVIDYGNNLVKFADTIVKHAEDAGVPNVYFQLFDDKGKWSPAVMTGTQFRQAQKEGKTDLFQLPTTGDPDTVTGNIIRTVTSFMVGRGNIAGKGAGVGKNVLADLVSGTTSMDPNSPRLSNIIDQVAPNAITNFLKAKPEDEGTVLGHVKSGLEMGGLGLAVNGVIRTLKATKAAFAATPATEAPAEAAAGPAADGVAPTPAAEASPAAEATTAKSALDQLLEMKDDIPWDQNVTARAATGTSLKDAALGAKAQGGVSVPPDEAAKKALALGYPEEGPLALATEKTPTVEVSPELKGRFENFMAQERGELASPLEANDKPLAAMRSADFSSTGANPVKVNLNAINGPADLKDAIARVSAQIPAQAVRHNDAVIDAANSLGMDADAFLAGPGRALSDTEVVGLRMVANDVARQALDHFKAAAVPGAGDEAKAHAMAAYAKFNDLISYMEGAKAESGRGVQAWGIKVAGLDVPYADAVKRIAEHAGEPGTPEFMERMATLDTPEQVAAAAQAARTMSARDWTVYGYTNALLGPKTIVKKAASDTFMGLWNTATRYAAERFGPERGVPTGETAQLLTGYKRGFDASMAMARKAIDEGRSQFGKFAGEPNDFLEMPQAGPQIADEAPTSAMQQFMRSSLKGLQKAMPTTWVGAIDDFATMLNYQAERRTLAFRYAAGQGLDGDELASKIASLEANTPTWLHKQAVAAAYQNTFKEPLTGIAATMQDFVDNANIPIAYTKDIANLMGARMEQNFQLPVGRIIAPFVKIPVNITRWSYTNSPLPLLFPSSRISAELAAGGATRDLALARIGLGSAVSLSLAGMALSGQITGRGPSDPQLQAAWKAAHGGDVRHSFKIGDNYYGYNSVEPIGLMAGIISDTYDIMRFAKEEDAQQAALSLVLGTGEALMSKTYLEGTANLLDAMQNPDKRSQAWFDHMVAPVGAPATVDAFRQALDPWMREHYHLLDSIEARLPYLSQGLPPQVTMWGKDIPAKDGYAPFLTGTGVARALSPVSVGPQADVEPIDKWIWDNRMAFPRGADNKTGLTRPALVQDFHAGRGVDAQVELTPEQHYRLSKLAGNELKDPSTGMGALDTLNALVEGNGRSMQSQWDRASPAEQALIVQTVVQKFRAAAKQQLLQEYPDIREAVEAGWQARTQALQPH